MGKRVPTGFTQRSQLFVTIDRNALGDRVITTAEVLAIGLDYSTVRGVGVAVKNPEDLDLAELGSDLAVGRALIDLGSKLRAGAHHEVATQAARRAQRQVTRASARARALRALKKDAARAKPTPSRRAKTKTAASA